jgi:hypothetical protein
MSKVMCRRLRRGKGSANLKRAYLWSMKMMREIEEAQQ